MRKSRNEIEVTKEEALAYMDPLEFGTASDPCFGKQFSLTAPECMICGDSVFCANKAKLRLSVAVIEEEEKEEGKEFLDTELVRLGNDHAEEYIKTKVESGRPHRVIFVMAKKKFQLPTDVINYFINKYK